MQDLYGNPIGKAPEFELTIYQKRQAAILYHYASLDYLKGLIPKIDEVSDTLYPTVKTAQSQGRDAVLKNKRWGTRDTSANYETYGGPFLSSLREITIKQIAEVAMEVYGRTDISYCYGGLRELSTDWMTDAEYECYEQVKEATYRYADKIDCTMDRAQAWDDSLLTREWLSVGAQLSPLPRLRVRTDVVAETGKKPPRTGVYLPQDDPNGSLQFAWTGGDHGALIECSTFNEIGIDALNVVGRADLWVNEPKMFEYLKNSRFGLTLKKDPSYDDYLNVDCAWSLISMRGFTTRPCKWYFVEMIAGEFDDSAGLALADLDEQLRMRCPAGQPCPKEGEWFTPARSGKQYFKQGEVMPDLKADYGQTIWEWAGD